ncbi:hypothetical protein [Opitutus sp. ER46]|uniref:hypothetical protein n=1 Tax=Opitutus sp. ER46 TaxID=2161864 RepID=UPI000D322A76|nr:hypothetical protein [Opitutus sp. ER46]PTX95719.1 hypothetical protein DB354_09925 [Opitutus sp. ER46]
MNSHTPPGVDLRDTSLPDEFALPLAPLQHLTLSDANGEPTVIDRQLALARLLDAGCKLTIS